MTCQPEGWARSGGPLVNHFAISADQCSVLRSPVTRDGVPWLLVLQTLCVASPAWCGNRLHKTQKKR
jgi:hypothetical protein